MRLPNPNNYIFLRFRKSKSKNKKYDAILLNKYTDAKIPISFGDKRFEQFRDSTGLNLYSKLNHGDCDRRRRFRARHKKNAKHKYSSAWFSYWYLW